MADCYSTSTVSGRSSLGGLVGSNGRTVTRCYSGSALRGNSSVGGLVGSAFRDTGGPWDLPHHRSCFWDIEVSGQTQSAWGTGKTTAEMQKASTFLGTNWDFVGETTNGTADLWWILEGKDYPRLSWELIPGN